MASANPNWSEILTTTLENFSGTIADNVSNNNALLTMINKGGNIMLEDGGESLIQELDFQENNTFKYYSDYDVLDVSGSNVLSAAQFDWKQATVNVSISGAEQMKNAGSKTRIHNLLRGKLRNADSTMRNNLSTGIYSDGTGASGKQIGGLQLLVADSPSTGTVGGINRANFEFWRNVSYDATTDGGAAATASNIQSYMNAVHLQLIRGSDKPNMIVADSNYYSLFEESLQDIQRITRADKGEAGFETLAYKNVPVMLDQAAPTNHMYFLNTDFLFWKVHRQRNFSVTPDLRPVNQDAIAKQILFMGNMTMSNASLQGVLKD